MRSDPLKEPPVTACFSAPPCPALHSVGCRVVQERRAKSSAGGTVTHHWALESSQHLQEQGRLKVTAGTEKTLPA